MDSIRKIIQEELNIIINETEDDGVPKYFNMEGYIAKLEIDKNFAYQTLERLVMVFETGGECEDIVIHAAKLIQDWDRIAG